MTEQEQYERIQEYILGRMPEEERAAFEKEMEADEALRARYKELSLLARAVRKANQEADLRIALKETEKRSARSSESGREWSYAAFAPADIERELEGLDYPFIFGWGSGEKISIPAAGFVDSPSGNTAAAGRVIQQPHYLKRTVVAFAVAASLSLAIILPHNARMAASGFDYAPSSLELQIFRGDTPDLLEKAASSYNAEDYAAALLYLDEAAADIDENLSQLSDDDSDIIARQSLTEDRSQVEWYRALTLMKEKKVHKAKRALRSIAASDSRYAEEAARVLKEVY